jgi:hypothetical protein
MPTVKGKFASRFYQRVVVPTDEGRALINAYVFDGRTTEELANQYGCSPATIADKASERDVSCETKPQGLDFQSIEDTGNLFSGYFQGLHNGSAPDFLDIASERYKRGEVEVIFKLRADGSNREYDLIFAPFDVIEEADVPGNNAAMGEIKTSEQQASNDKSVFGLITNFVECPNKMVVPSFVRLEPAKQRTDIRGERPSFCSAQVSFKLRCRVRDGEVNVLSEIRSVGESNSVSGVVEARSQVRDRIESTISDDVGNQSDNTQLMEFMSTIRLYLSDRGVWLGPQVGIDFPFQVRDMFVCAREPAACAPERIIHSVRS